ncbi:MAG TPA: DUF4416 family protein, partial [Fibrobacteria bacterium]|nr:DUF4416 family protein [Fibrobacteria bacterium]
MVSPVTPPDPACKRVLAVLSPSSEWAPSLVSALEENFGNIDYRGPFLPFPEGAYYAGEMGAPLWRGWLSFRGVVGPGFLPEWTQRFRELEATL